MLCRQIRLQSHFRLRQYELFELISGFWICFLYIHNLVGLVQNPFCNIGDTFHTLCRHGVRSVCLVNWLPIH